VSNPAGITFPIIKLKSATYSFGKDADRDWLLKGWFSVRLHYRFNGYPYLMVYDVAPLMVLLRNWIACSL